MAFGKDRSERWRRFLGPSPGAARKAVDILRQRYVEEMQAADRFKQHLQVKQHLQEIQYPQFRENFSVSRRTKVNMLSGLPKR